MDPIQGEHPVLWVAQHVSNASSLNLRKTRLYLVDTSKGPPSNAGFNVIPNFASTLF